MSNTPTTTPPPPGTGGELAPEEHAQRALDILMATPEPTLRMVLGRVAQMETEKESVISAVRELESHVGTLVGTTAALREGVENMAPRLGELSAAVVAITGQMSSVSGSVQLLCELHEAGFREIREDLSQLVRGTRDDVRAIEQLVDREVQGMHGTIEVLGTQVIENRSRLDVTDKRWAEHGSRLGAIEADAGEVGDGTPGKPGHGWRFKLATLWAEHGQRQKSNALALGGGAIAGGPLAYAVVELVKLLASAWGH
jgi:hypothetical protein